MRNVAFSGLLLAMAGCASAPLDPDAEAQLTTDFELGSVEMDCLIPCAASWGWHSEEMLGMYQVGLWQDLAILVLTVGYDIDLSWFYLARAAEELGHDSAAERYFRKAKASNLKHPCKGLFDNCDGFDLPVLLDERVAEYDQQRAEKRQQQAAASEPEPEQPIDVAPAPVVAPAPTPGKPVVPAPVVPTERTYCATSNNTLVYVRAAGKHCDSATDRKITRTEYESITKAAQEAAEAKRIAAKNKVTIDDSNFEQVATFVGSEIHESVDKFPRSEYVFFLRSWVDKKTLNAKHQLYVAETYFGGDWHNWLIATDANANPLEVVDIDSDVLSCRGGCTHVETIGVSLTDRFVRQSMDGFSIQIAARSGKKKVLTIPAEKVTAQLDTIDQYRQAR